MAVPLQRMLEGVFAKARLLKPGVLAGTIEKVGFRRHVF
jgi:hypothetical protein